MILLNIENISKYDEINKSGKAQKQSGGKFFKHLILPVHLTNSCENLQPQYNKWYINLVLEQHIFSKKETKLFNVGINQEWR